MITESDIDALRVRAGDPITAAIWNALLDLCSGLAKSYGDVSAGKGVRLHRYPHGINIVADTGTATFAGAFTVRAAGLKVTIGTGTLNAVVPTIRAAPIDGLVDGKQQTIPTLDVSYPGETKRSFVCLRVKVDAAQLIADEPDAITVVHRASMPAADEPAEIGLHVVAVLQWSNTKAFSIRQVLYHDQQHVAVMSKTGTLRHFFSAAA